MNEMKGKGPGGWPSTHPGKPSGGGRTNNTPRRWLLVENTSFLFSFFLI